MANSMSVNFTAKGEELVSLSAKRADRFNLFLDAVSKFSSKGDIPIGDLVRKEARKLDWEATAVVITPCIEKNASAFLSLKASGTELVIIYLCGDGANGGKDAEILKSSGLNVFAVGLEDDINQVLGGHYE
ncbi:MAG: hypothetical protein PHI04_05535 [Clostridiaceae bacterium]|nr:hypothetical protein [Clostridiaceae bacterium]